MQLVIIISFCTNLLCWFLFNVSLKVEFVILSFDLSLSPDLKHVCKKETSHYRFVGLLLIVLPSTKNLFIK